MVARHDDEILGTSETTDELHVPQAVASRRLLDSRSLKEPDGQRHTKQRQKSHEILREWRTCSSGVGGSVAESGSMCAQKSGVSRLASDQDLDAADDAAEI